MSRTERDVSPSSARPELDLQQFLPYRLNSLADRISQTLAQLYAERYQINIAEWRVLAWLSHLDQLSARQICQATRMDKARVSRAVQALEERGLIQRTPSARDQRVHDLCLTPDGRMLLESLIPEARQWESDLLATLSVNEYRDMMSIMSKLERQLDRLEQGAGLDAETGTDSPRARRG